jgi:hypothetical protein
VFGGFSVMGNGEWELGGWMIAMQWGVDGHGMEMVITRVR